MTLFIFVLTYLVATFVTRFTALGEYRWFNELESRLIYKYPSREEKIRNLFSFKLFHCTACHSFWISIPIYSIFYSDPINIIFALLTYLLIKTENGTTN